MKALLAKQKMINKVVLIPEHRIKPNPYQPRRVFDQEKIEQLAASIAQYGLLQPITVLPLEDGSYQLVAGERRLLACRRLRMQEVPAILTTMDEERSSALALVENIQRCDLNFFEEAAAIQKLMKMGGYTQQAVAKKLGKNQSTIANKLRLLQFSELVREAILAAPSLCKRSFASFSKGSGCPAGSACWSSSAELETSLSSSAFAGEFCNPSFGLQKRGLL